MMMKADPRLALLAGLGALSLLAGCAPQGGAAEATRADADAAANARHPVSGLAVVPLTVTSKGKAHRFRVEVAASMQEQAQGLMFRTTLGPDEGMIFPRNPPDFASFWMKNTPLPLDIIFIGADGRIINIAARTVPYSLDSVRSARLAAAVLELPGGRAAELGIGPGDKVAW